MRFSLGKRKFHRDIPTNRKTEPSWWSRLNSSWSSRIFCVLYDLRSRMNINISTIYSRAVLRYGSNAFGSRFHNP